MPVIRGTLLLLLALACQAATRVGSVIATTGSAVSSTTASYSPTTGNTVFVIFTAYKSGGGQPSTMDVDDGGTNTYANDLTFFNSNRSTLTIFRASNVTGGSFTYTGTITGGGGFLNLIVVEYSGLVNVSPADGSPVSASGNFGSGGTMDSGPLTTTHASDLLLGPWVNDSGAPVSFSAGSGWAVIQQNLNGACCAIASVMEQFVLATGTYNATGTQTNFGDRTGIAIAAYKVTGAVAVTKVKVNIQ